MRTVADIMTTPVTSVVMDASLRTIQRIFDESGFRHLVVIKDRKAVGVISDRDLLRNLSPFIGNDMLERPQDIHTLRKCAHQIMHRDLISVDPEASMKRAVGLLLSHDIGCLPVIDKNEHLRGIVTWRDLLPHGEWGDAQDTANAA